MDDNCIISCLLKHNLRSTAPENAPLKHSKDNANEKENNNSNKEVKTKGCTKKKKEHWEKANSSFRKSMKTHRKIGHAR